VTTNDGPALFESRLTRIRCPRIQIPSNVHRDRKAFAAERAIEQTWGCSKTESPGLWRVERKFENSSLVDYAEDFGRTEIRSESFNTDVEVSVFGDARIHEK